MTDAPTPAPAQSGLRSNAIGFWASIGVGVAATTPATGVALVFGLMAAGVGFQMPGAIILGFLPILLIASAYMYLNRADPDCGTTFAWATRAFGPYVGWIGGWVVVATLAVIVTNYAQLLGAYSFLLVGAEGLADDTLAVTVLGTAWFAGLTLVAYRGIELSKRVQLPLLAFELIVLTGFAVVAIVRVVFGDVAGSSAPAASWFDPTSLSTAALASGFVTGVLLFWGWDTSVMINEESENRTRTPGRAAVTSTIVLLAFYVICAVGVLAWAGPERIAAQPDDVVGLLAPEVLGGTLDQIVVLAVLTSAIAGGVFLPIGGARTLLSMARHGALPASLARIDSRFRTPTTATLAFAGIGLVYYLVMTVISDTVLVDSLTALGLLVALYYALTGLACVVYFRAGRGKSWAAKLQLGLFPLIGSLALIFVIGKNGADLADPAASAGGTEWFGLGAPLVIAVVILLIGVVAMLVRRATAPAFFRRRPEAAPLQAADDPVNRPAVPVA